MEKRKIQGTGGSSFSITLPKKWVQAHRIKEQDTVTVLPRKTGALVIQPPQAGKGQARRTLPIDDLTDDEIRREIVALYIVGIEEADIVARTITKRERLAVRQALERVMGFEVIEESSRNIVIRNMLSPEKFSFQQGMDKMFSMTRSMFGDGITAFTAKNKELAQDVVVRDLEVDKLYFLILRHNHSLLQDQVSEEQMGYGVVAAKYYAYIATQLERIADHAVKISQVVIESRLTPNSRFNRLIQQTLPKILPLLQAANEFTRTVDKKMAHRILNTILKTEEDIRTMHREIIRGGLIEAVIVADSLDRLLGYIANMAEVTIDQSFLEP